MEAETNRFPPAHDEDLTGQKCQYYPPSLGRRRSQSSTSTTCQECVVKKKESSLRKDAERNSARRRRTFPKQRNITTASNRRPNNGIDHDRGGERPNRIDVWKVRLDEFLTRVTHLKSSGSSREHNPSLTTNSLTSRSPSFAEFWFLYILLIKLN